MPHGLLTQTQQEYYDSGNHGGYQFINLLDVIDNFTATYVGEGKILEKTSRADVSFHAHRALAELSFDTFKSCKSQEITVPASLSMILPQDYVNYVKLTWSDSSGIEHVIYPTSKTSNPTTIHQDSDGEFQFEVTGTFDSSLGAVVLDDAYPLIEPGDKVISPYIPSTQNIIALIDSQTTTEKTILYIAEDTSGTNIWSPTPAAAEVTLQIVKADGSAFKPDGGSYTAIGVAITSGDDFVTVSSTDAGNIKVGMLVHCFSQATLPPDTFVVAINGTRVTLSNPIGTSITSAEINFIDQTFDSATWSNYKSATPSENNNDDYEDDKYWPAGGERYGLDPQHAQVNGSFYMDCNTGKIHFSSNLSGKTVTLKYISDGLGTDTEMVVHKFAEEAIYKWIAYGCLSARANVPGGVLARFKKEKFAETRKAKLRLSNIKLEEVTQILRGKSKQIKH